MKNTNINITKMKNKNKSKNRKYNIVLLSTYINTSNIQIESRLEDFIEASDLADAHLKAAQICTNINSVNSNSAYCYEISEINIVEEF